MTQQRAAFDTLLQPHLDRVSRSFALCIRELQEPLRSWTALAYLICRLADTVEDAPWAEPNKQHCAFDALNGFFAARPSSEATQHFAASFPAGIEPGERQLLQDSHLLFGALHDLAAPPRQSIVDVARRMSHGMRYYSRMWSEQRSLTLLDLEDVNRYCYFVAGVVGEMLTQLFVLSHPNFVACGSLWLDGQHFGLFLQKVNLLKDQLKDEAENRFLCPSRAALSASLTEHAEGALRYISALPQDDAGRAFRVFCAWSMFLGAASLPYIQADYASAGSGIKISRQKTQELMQHIAAMACDNDALQSAMHTAMASLHLPSPGQAPTKTLAQAASASQAERRAWFLALDHGPLSRSDLCALGMAPPEP